jgi:DNA-binding NarL/FixJ family response regulator
MSESMSVMVEQVGVLVVADDAFARSGLCAAIQAEPDFTVAGEAADCAGALAFAEREDIRVVVLRARPDERCLELLRDLDRLSHDVAVLVLGRSAGGDGVLRLVQAGVAAYLDASASPDDVTCAIRTVAGGGHVLDPLALSGVVHDYIARCDQKLGAGAYTLTPREREVLTLVAEGLSTREIASRLVLSHKTVEVHRQRIMDKLDLHKVADLVRFALREGLVSPEVN